MFLGGEPPPSSIIQKVGWQDNPWFPKRLKTQMEWQKTRDYNKYLHVWEGDPIISNESRVFRNWKSDDIDDQMPKDAVPMLGADWGFSNDPTVLIECYQWDRVLYFRREKYKVHCDIDETPAFFAGSDRLEPARWGNSYGHDGMDSVRNGHRIVADSARPELIKYLRDRGFKISRAKKGAGSVEDGIEYINSHDVFIHPEAENAIYEFSMYSWKTDPLTDEVLPVLADKDNHVVDASRYATENKRRSLRGGVSTSAPQLIYIN